MKRVNDYTSFFKQKALGERLHLVIHVLRLGLGNVRAVSAFAVVSISKFRLLLQTSSVHMATARL